MPSVVFDVRIRRLIDLPIVVPSNDSKLIVVAKTLESSTADMAREFTNLIVYQRGYQANSRVITTMSELTQETINLIR